MQPVRAILAIFTAALIAAQANAVTVEQIRAEWQKLRRFESPPVGQWLAVAADDYSPSATDQPDPARAAKLAELAHQAAEQGEAALAVRLATEAVDADPDCEPARLALGYEKLDGRWVTAYGARMAGRGQVWNSNYGWIKPSDLARYEAGERPLRRRWVSTEIDADAHREITEGWQVRTDHFNVTTNHSLEAGVELAAKLEQLHQLWLQLFADFAIDDRELKARFEEHRVPGVRSRPFQVVFHRDRQQYNRELRRRQPMIDKTIGIYFDHQREAHFFYSAELSIDETLYHESVHQLFQESDRARRDPGMKSNFWAIEAIACWFETLARAESESGGQFFTIGTPGSGRLPAARRRLLAEGYRVPLIELVAIAKNDLQRRTDLVALYSQCTGLAAYWMQNPERQRVFVEYLKQVYAGKAKEATLSELSNKPYGEIDGEYQQFMQQMPGE